MSNSILIIRPYKFEGTWVFDDPDVGLVREPFVAGADTIIDRMVKDIPNAAEGVTLLFSANAFPGFEYEFRREREEADGNWYWSEFDLVAGTMIIRSRKAARHAMLLTLKKAGLTPWVRLFHNLRGSLETDLMERYPARVVVTWLGNSKRIALQHYLKVTPHHLADAIDFDLVGRHLGTNPGNQLNRPQADQAKTRTCKKPKLSRVKK